MPIQEYDSFINNKNFSCTVTRVWPASVALSVASRYALLRYGDRRVWVRGPDWPNHCVRLYIYNFIRQMAAI